MKSLHPIRGLAPPSVTLNTTGQLTVLNLARNNFTGTTAFAGLEHLQELTLAQNDIGDLTGIESLTNLDVLLLSDNRLASLVPLAGLTGLRVLNLRNNLISDIRALNRPALFSNNGWLQAQDNCIGEGIAIMPVNQETVDNLLEWGVTVQVTPFLPTGACE